MRRIKMPQMIVEIASAVFKKPFTFQYPFTKPKVPEGLRGRQIFHPERCISCGLCARDCPAEAIEMVEVSGKKMPLIHLDSCIFCYICVENCPRNALTESTFYELASTNKESLALRPEKPESEGEATEGE
ncbi:4Fe-4S dicluster domain-containing protein [Candidatus Bathyarchaeota archaeon]|nr:4Fe-4S binding protein [Candidatus Bathyarchaeota archaeon]RJS87640.1 MAG: 4Fe-4S dicluster domain-containing protein [Candidatus Bathyarchaeota archaeon]RLI00030.1 MAG: ferredoxin [Candidatus Bathyarchaeota archaeon]RLI06621.1 MAG: ferredoxin [Candidatus Bathyarchaeota archaeon]